MRKVPSTVSQYDHGDGVLVCVVMTRKAENYNFLSSFATWVSTSSAVMLLWCFKKEISKAYLKIPSVFGMFPILRNLCLFEKLFSFCQPLIKYLHIIMKPPPFFHRSVKSSRGEKYGWRKINRLYKTNYVNIAQNFH